MDRKALIGLLSGISVVVATMIGIALINTRPAEGADTVARIEGPHDCARAAAMTDSGYAIAPAGEACGRNY